MRRSAGPIAVLAASFVLFAAGVRLMFAPPRYYPAVNATLGPSAVTFVHGYSRTEPWQMVVRYGDVTEAAEAGGALWVFTSRWAYRLPPRPAASVAAWRGRLVARAHLSPVASTRYGSVWLRAGGVVIPPRSAMWRSFGGMALALVTFVTGIVSLAMVNNARARKRRRRPARIEFSG